MESKMTKTKKFLARKLGKTENILYYTKNGKHCLKAWFL